MESEVKAEVTEVAEQLRDQERIVALPAGQTALGAIADEVWGRALRSMLSDPKRPGL